LAVGKLLAVSVGAFKGAWLIGTTIAIRSTVWLEARRPISAAIVVGTALLEARGPTRVTIVVGTILLEAWGPISVAVVVGTILLEARGPTRVTIVSRAILLEARRPISAAVVVRAILLEARRPISTAVVSRTILLEARRAAILPAFRVTSGLLWRGVARPAFAIQTCLASWCAVSWLVKATWPIFGLLALWISTGS